MSQTAITLAFEQWKASQAVTGEPVLLDEFVFANVPGLDVSKPVDRNETLPPAAQIVHRQPVSRKGVVNENAVVHSVVLGADVGDFSFNWIGLINKASNTLAMIVHAPFQQKLKTKDGQQGNVLTRSFLMEYNGAQAETGINTPAETWQIDFTARMAGIDERQRLENIDLYGAAAFLSNGWLVAKNGSQYFVTAGAGYVRGLRAELAANQNITVAAKPVKVWLDVAWTGTLTSVWGVASKITLAANLADYVQNGVQHYVFAVASIDANGNITDLRPKGTLNDQAASDALAKHEKSRNHPDGTLNAKGFVQLSNSVESDSELLAATSKAVKTAYELAKGKYTAQDATTAQKGIVQLSSATDSSSEVLAATPKAVSSAVKALKDTLGTAAVKNIATSYDDTTVGRIPVVGWQGLGLAAQFRMGQVSQFLAYASADLKEVPSNGAGWQSAYGASRRAQIFIDTVGNVYSRFSMSDVALDTNTPWAIHYTTLNKPTAADVNAIPLTGSTAVTGIIRSSAEFQTTSANCYRMVGGNYGAFWRQDGSNLYLMLTNSGDQYGNYNSLRPFAVSLSSGDVTIGKLNLTSFQYFDARYYTKAQSDAGYMPKTGAYTKAESDGRYQPKGSYAAPDTSGISGNIIWWKNTATGVITMMGQTTGVANGGRVTFPFAFPSKCFGVIPTRNNSTGQGAAMQPYDVNTTGWNLRIAGGGTETVMWTAMGK